MPTRPRWGLIGRNPLGVDLQLKLKPVADTYVAAPERRQPAPEKTAVLDKIIRPVQQEIQALERLCKTPNLPVPIKEQYERAIGRLRQFVKDVNDHRDPRAAYREHVTAARHHLQAAQNMASKLLQRQAGAVLERCAALGPVLTADENGLLRPALELAAKYQEGNLSAGQAKELNDALAELQRLIPALARQAAQRAQNKLVAAINDVRGPLRQLLAADEQVGAQGRAVSAPWGFIGIAGLLATNPAARQGTTLPDRLRATHNPEAARSVADLLLSLDQLEADVRSGKPLSTDRLLDLQRIAASPVIARTQSAVKVGAVVEGAKVVAVSSSIVVVGGFTGGLAAEAFAAFAGPGVLTGLGALLVEGTVFTAVTVPLEYAVGIGELPASGEAWAQRVVTNSAMIGTFKVAGKAYQTFAGATRLPSFPVWHEIGRLSTSFAAMNGFALGEQLVRGEDPNLVFSWSNVGQQAWSALPNFVGMELAGRLSRPLTAPLHERVSAWRASRLQLTVPEIVATEVTVSERGVVEVKAPEVEEGTGVGVNKFLDDPRMNGALPQEAIGPGGRKSALWFESPEELLSFISVTEGNRPGVAEQRARIAREHPHEPAYLVDAREQAQAIWEKMTPAEKAQARKCAGGEITPDTLIEHAPELLMGASGNPRFQQLVTIKVELNGLQMWAEHVAPKHGIKPEWMDRLVLEDHWLTAEVNNFNEAKPDGRDFIFGQMIGRTDTSLVKPEEVTLGKGKRPWKVAVTIDGPVLAGPDGKIVNDVTVKVESSGGNQFITIIDQPTGHVVEMGRNNNGMFEPIGGNDTYHSLLKRFGAAAADRIIGLRLAFQRGVSVPATDVPIALHKSKSDQHSVEIPVGLSLTIKPAGVPIRLYNLRGTFYVQAMGENPAEPVMIATQKMGSGPTAKKVGIFTVGRTSDSTLVIEDGRVSGRHLTIAVEESKVVIKDTSSNGTLVEPKLDLYRPVGPNGGLIERGVEFVSKEQAAKYSGPKEVVALEHGAYAIVDVEILPPALLKKGQTPSMTRAELIGYRDAHLRPLEESLAQATQIQSTHLGDAAFGFERPPISTSAAQAAGRPAMAGQAGSHFVLKPLPGQKLVFIGDLHGNVGNLRRILAEYGPKLQKGEVVLVFMGDAIHAEEGNMTDITGSVEVTDVLLQLKNEYPNSVHYIRGNHDQVVGGAEERFFKRDANGMPVFQGIVFRDKLIAARGEEYAQALQAFFEASPQVVAFEAAGKKHSASHCVADPDKIGVPLSPQNAINATFVPQLTRAFTSSRPYEDYDPSALPKWRQSMGLSSDGLVVVGHTHDPSGNGAAAWIPQNMPGHLVLMSSSSQNLSVLEADAGGMRVKDLVGRSGLSR